MVLAQQQPQRPKEEGQHLVLAYRQPEKQLEEKRLHLVSVHQQPQMRKETRRHFVLAQQQEERGTGRDPAPGFGKIWPEKTRPLEFGTLC